MAKDKAVARGPQSPHSEKPLESVSGKELEAWAAQELDGFTGVSKKADGSFEGTKNGKKPVPGYLRDKAEIKRLQASVLVGARKLILRDGSGAIKTVDEADADMLILALRALVLESMYKRGVVT